MNPNTNRLEALHTAEEFDRLMERAGLPLSERPTPPAGPGGLVRADGSPVPKTWATFSVGEEVVIKDYTFRVAYIGESNLVLEPVGPVLGGNRKQRRKAKRSRR